MTISQNAAPEVHATEVDDLADWVARLEQARKAKALAESAEKECKDVIGRYLSEREAEYGTINGRVAIRAHQVTKTYAPSVSVLREVAPEILKEYGKQSTYTQLTLVKDN